MVAWFGTPLRAHQHAACFPASAIGCFIGRLKFGDFAPGSVSGVLLADAAPGPLGVTVNSDVAQIFTLGHCVSHAVGNGLLASRGTVIVSLLH